MWAGECEMRHRLGGQLGPDASTIRRQAPHVGKKPLGFELGTTGRQG
jgi:hypothetical protein